MSERVQQLESQIQGKLDQARERRENMEREQKEKLRNHVSWLSPISMYNISIMFWRETKYEHTNSRYGLSEYVEDSESTRNARYEGTWDEKNWDRHEGVDRGGEPRTRDSTSYPGYSPTSNSFD